MIKDVFILKTLTHLTLTQTQTLAEIINKKNVVSHININAI